MGLYMCGKCGALVENFRFPSSAGCPSGGSHKWVKLCEGSLVAKEGLKPYQCSKCGTLVYCRNYPSTAGCPRGGSHRWVRL